MKFPFWRIALEFKIQDLWIGVFWDKSAEVVPQGKPTFALPVCDRLDIWICLIPCLPIHLCRISNPSTEEKA